MSTFYRLFIVSLTVALCCAYPLKDFEQNPEETAGYFEGDMILSESNLIQARNGLIARANRWPDRMVYYKISSDFDSSHRTQILKAISILDAATCLTFKEADATTKYYINIAASEPTKGCASTVGYQKSVQRMNLEIYPLNQGCFRIGSILHELLHTLGFFHQQSASDRDEYITVNVENIKSGMEYNFKKQDGTENFGIPYDYKSVLHYSAFAFSKNGEKTIVTRDPNAVIGQRTGLSEKDIAKVNAMYLCPIQI